MHVITEKPLAHTVADGQRLVAAADRTSAKIAVCFQNRYNAGVVAIHRLLTSGDVGEMTGASATVMWHRRPTTTATGRGGAAGRPAAAGY